MQRYPQGVVEREGERYVGHCYELGTECYGRTVEEAFANLRRATWKQLERQQALGSDAGLREWQPKDGCAA